MFRCKVILKALLIASLSYWTPVATAAFIADPDYLDDLTYPLRSAIERGLFRADSVVLR